MPVIPAGRRVRRAERRRIRANVRRDPLAAMFSARVEHIRALARIARLRRFAAEAGDHPFAIEAKGYARGLLHDARRDRAALPRLP